MNLDRELTGLQEEVLSELLKLYEKLGRIVKSREIAERLKRREGTIKVILSHLKDMGLIEAKPGPQGGYVPTETAYEILGRKAPKLRLLLKDPTGKVIGEIKDLELSLNADEIKAVLKVNFFENDITKNVIVENIGGRYLRIEGGVEALDARALTIKVNKLLYIPVKEVGSIVKRDLVILKSNTSFKEAVRILHSRGIRGAPVSDLQGRIIGFITVTDIALALAEGAKPEEEIKNYIRKGVFSIPEDRDLTEAIKVMNEYGIGRLLVTDRTGRPIGMITRTDVIRGLLEIK